MWAGEAADVLHTSPACPHYESGLWPLTAVRAAIVSHGPDRMTGMKMTTSRPRRNTALWLVWLLGISLVPLMIGGVLLLVFAHMQIVFARMD